LSIPVKYIVRALFILVAIACAAPAMAQNTKGDRAVDNQKTVRQTKGKSVKKKSKATTRDIAGRRLRTKNKSSANRANVGIPQPATTSRQPRRVHDRPAPVRADKHFASKERRRSDPDRSWQGDISGYKARKIKPSSAEETGRNVYPQREYATRRPMGDQPFKSHETKTSSGRKIVKRTPQRTEKAWKGDIKGQPFFAPKSQTGRVNNLYSQKTRYSKYVSKKPSGRDVAFDNKAKVSKAKRIGTDTSPKNWRQSVVTASGQKPFVTRGRKNVYWGKVKIRERAKTGDLTGRTLQKRNFRSAGIGLTGTDTLAFFGRKPHGDMMGGRKRSGRYISGSEAKGGWLNDIAGYRLRKKIPGGAEAAGSHRYSGFRSVSGLFRNNKPVQTKAPGIGAAALAGGLKRTKGMDGRNMQDQGGSFTGFLKSRKPYKFTGGKAGALWNNNRTPIAGKGVPASAYQAGRFSGRGRGGKTFADQGSGFTGYLKATKPYRFKGSGSGKLWNNDNTPVQGKLLPGGAERAGRFSGNTKGKAEKNFADQGSAFTGSLKARKPHKFGGSLTGGLWNNNQKAVTQLETGRATAAAGSFQGRTKTRGPEKGKLTATPDKLWNNKENAVTRLETTKDVARAGYYQGGKKVREPQKSKIAASPNRLWNNNEKATTQRQSTKSGLAAGGFQGRNKAKRPETHPLNSNNVLWNNEGKATTQIKLTNSAARAGSFHGNVKYKKEDKNRDDNIQARLKMKREYTQNPHSVEEATKKQKPELNYKAGNFASGVKVTGKRKHNPNSDDDALDGLYHASARRTDYQGNVKMKKFFDRHGESPDAKFVNQGENNVKEDRTIVTNMKLFWTKLFQKSESQPANLKDKSNKLRYDKKEKGMWAD
jgi:hypothetical protein